MKRGRTGMKMKPMPKKAKTSPVYGVGARRADYLYKSGGLTGTELKYLDSAKVASAIVSPADGSGAEQDPATVNCLNAIAQGDGESNRDGRRCVMKSVYVTGLVEYPAQADQTAMDPGTKTYIALVLDKQTNGAQLNSEDVFLNPSGNGLVAADPLRNLSYSNRFTVLDNVTVEQDSPNGVYDGTNIELGGAVRSFKLSKKFTIPVNFTGTAAGVSTIQDNSLHVIAYTSRASTAAPTLSYNARVRFVG